MALTYSGMQHAPLRILYTMHRGRIIKLIRRHDRMKIYRDLTNKYIQQKKLKCNVIQTSIYSRRSLSVTLYKQVYTAEEAEV